MKATHEQRDFKIKQSNRQLNAKEATLRIIILYLFLGFTWILTSDYLLNFMFKDSGLYTMIQSIKGILYVIITGIVFYIIIYHRIYQYTDSLHQLNRAYQELDVSHQNSLKLEDNLYQLAYYDQLTGLPNKILLEKTIQKMINQNLDEQKFAMIYFDIDEFRHINETRGHIIGDMLIKQIARRLNDIVQEDAFIARMGGDEFVIILKHIIIQKLNARVMSVMDQLRGNYALGEDDHFVTLSAGVSVFPTHGQDYINLLRHADMALSQAKSNRKDQVVIYDDKMTDAVSQQSILTNQLRNAIQNNEFYLHYQPIVSLKQNQIKGVEALLRWKNPILGNIPPLEFIPLAEMNGFIHELTEWVFQQVGKDLAQWPNRETFRVSINLSTVVLTDQLFIKRLPSWLKRYKIDPKRIILEITETAFIHDLELGIGVVKKLSELGFLVALDDFGSGYSSLTYLQMLPINIVKIDRGFIMNITEDAQEVFVLKAMIDISHHMKLNVVAEGIETEVQDQLMKSFDVDFAQGYLYSRPTLIEDVLKLL